MEDYRIEEGEFQSSDKRSTVHYTLYRPRAPIAVCQVIHGMLEYFKRYEDFARFLCSNGVAVVGADLLGHGLTAPSDDELGNFDDYENLIEDQKKLLDIVRKTYRSLPYMLLGHSMGSFVARAFVTRYKDAVDGAVFCGTAGSNKRIGFGIFMAKLLKTFRGAKYHSKYLAKNVGGSFEEAAGDEANGNWLTKNTELLDRFKDDKYCKISFTAAAYLQLFELLKEISSDEWYAEVPKSLPILLMSGTDDPVGDMSVGVHEVFDRLEDAEINDLRLKLYEGDRHEILNETDRETVWADTLAFITDVCDGVRAARMDAAYLMNGFAGHSEPQS